MFLYGKRSVVERLRAAPDTIRSITLQRGLDLPEVVQAAKKAGKPFSSVAKPDFEKLARTLHTQGVVAEVDDFRYAEIEDLIQQDPKPTLFMLDRVTDPQNLGNILRTVACLGSIALVIPKHEAAGVSETVLRVACGGENYVPVALVTNLVQAAELAKKFGYWIAGAHAEGGTLIHKVSWPFPLAVVIGSEGEGIRPGLKKHLEMTVTLPMPGASLSFNVATATALIAYEITRQRLSEKK